VVGSRDMHLFLENFPRSGFALLDRAGHNLQIEQEKLFHTFLADWLDRVELEE
jgi:pimeloyl-ACP methyl ester carboxylesterase